jgi:glycosyltransferase involved in cell wall biosynthesis
MKRILFLSDINSPHTQKWVTGLAESDFVIGVFSLSPSKSDWYKHISNVTVLNKSNINQNVFYSGVSAKLGYLKLISVLKAAVVSFKPNLVHANYASSYGLLGALLNKKPFFISVWGSDVFDFPKKNFINKNVLRYNLNKADVIISASKIMCAETAVYTKTKIVHIPFGIDTKVFKPDETASTPLTIGTVKRMDDIYGIDILIRAFASIAHLTDANLLLVGDGVKTDEYLGLVKKLGIAKRVHFQGWIPHDQIVQYHNKMDVFIAVSRSESFGVAVIEASACGKPVVVSNVGGLPEVVLQNKTGFIVECENVEATATAILKLCNNPLLRKQMGNEGRKFVIQNYTWQDNLQQMVKLYNQYL